MYRHLRLTRQEDENGPGAHVEADVLDQPHHQLQVDLLQVHVPQGLQDEGGVLPPGLQRAEVLFQLGLLLLLLFVLLATTAKVAVEASRLFGTGRGVEAGGEERERDI